jgi:hypothetical protein
MLCQLLHAYKAGFASVGTYRTYKYIDVEVCEVTESKTDL